MHYYNPFNFISLSFLPAVYLYSSIIFLILGYLVVHSLYLPEKMNFYYEEPESRILFIDTKKLGLLVLVFSVISILGIIIYVKQLSQLLGGLDIYFENPFMARKKFIEIQNQGLKSYNILLSLGSWLKSFIYPLNVVSGVLFTRKTKWRYFAFLPIIGGTLDSLISLNRMNILTAFLLWSFAFYYTSFFFEKKESRKLFFRVMKYNIVSFLLLLGFFYLIIRMRTFYMIDFRKYIIKSVYSYYAGTISAFEIFIHYDEPLLLGKSTFRTVFKWFTRFGLWNSDDLVGIHETFCRIGANQVVNTYTYVKTLFEDFGIIGVTFVSAFLGGLVRYSVEKLRLKFDLMRLLLVCVFSFTLFLSFFGFYLSSLTKIFYWFIVIYILNHFIKKNNIIRVSNTE